MVILVCQWGWGWGMAMEIAMVMVMVMVVYLCKLMHESWLVIRFALEYETR